MSALIRVCMVLRDYNPRPRSLKTRVGGLCVESILSYIIKPCLGRKKTTRHMHAPLIHFLFCLPRAAIGNTLFCDLHCRNATQQKLELHSLSPVSNGTLCDTLHFLRPVALFSFAQTDIQLLASAWYKHFTTSLLPASAVLGFAVWLAAHHVTFNVPGKFSFCPF